MVLPQTARNLFGGIFASVCFMAWSFHGNGCKKFTCYTALPKCFASTLTSLPEVWNVAILVCLSVLICRVLSMSFIHPGLARALTFFLSWMANSRGIIWRITLQIQKIQQWNTGRPQQGNTGRPQQWNTGRPQQWNTGCPQQWNTGCPQQWNTGCPQQWNTGRPQQW